MFNVCQSVSFYITLTPSTQKGRIIQYLLLFLIFAMSCSNRFSSKAKNYTFQCGIVLYSKTVWWNVYIITICDKIILL